MKFNINLKLLGLFVTIFIFYTLNLNLDYQKDLKNKDFRRLMPTADVVPNTFLPYQILVNKTLKFNEIRFYLRVFDGNHKHPYFLYTNKEDQTFSVYPIITGLFALPVYLLPIILDKIPTLAYPENILKIFALGRFTAILYSLGSVYLMYKILDKRSKRTNLIIIFLAFYALGTGTMSIASRGLWQHTISQFLNSIVLLILLTLQNDKPPTKKPLVLLGFITGLSVLTRPTNILLAFAVLMYVLFRYKVKKVFPFIIGVIPNVIFMLFYNVYAFGSPFMEGYGIRNDYNWGTPLSESLSGYLVSPARGLLFISPPLLLAFYTMYKIFASKKYKIEINVLIRYLTLGVVLTILMMGKWYTWHGANAFGHRMLVDILPFLALLAFEALVELKPKTLYIIYVLMLYSIVIHSNAVYFKKSRCNEENNWNFECLKLGLDTTIHQSTKV